MIATGRKLAALEGLKAEGASTLELDVTAPLDTLKAIAEEAVGLHDRVDVVVNNAGYIEIGALEELTCVQLLHFALASAPSINPHTHSLSLATVRKRRSNSSSLFNTIFWEAVREI